VILVHDPRFYTKAVLGGSIGAAEGYMAGYWSADDLTNLIRIMTLNHRVQTGFEKGLARLTFPFHRLYHLLHGNTKKGSRKNIAAHYDLGNDFYKLFLDETMTYSCGIFERPESSLGEASVAKYDRICRKLRLGPDTELLEIGCGWGGFAMHAASRYGCRVTTTTISRQQYEVARERIRTAGLADRITLLQDDYRDLRGNYDRLVSIEMIEAVGYGYMETFLGNCARLLKPDGMLLLQGITMPDHLFDRYKYSVDFINRYIFPGSCLTSVTSLTSAAARATDLRLVHLEDITSHYARTLREWRRRFFERIDDVRSLGYPEEFIRMWEFYLCYCEGGFAERYVGDVQLLFTRPFCRLEAPLPALA
ncbi:MAG: class I SAM-dependent methyltransferase, partial [Deltaproteobacteria bacterium]|nr:class I SAM-dependent methyltransferase [Deltaproteobacteria bacterium]